MAAYINSEFTSNEDAKLHVSDLAWQRGFAVFDFFRTVNGVPLFMEDHLDRFFASAAGMHLEPGKSREELRNIIQELIRRSSLPEAGMRLMLTGGYSPDTYHPAAPNLVITCNPVRTATTTDFEKGFSVITKEYQRELPAIKSINYMMAVWLQPLLAEKGADDVLYYNKESITEFPRSNVFMVTREDKLVTPARNMLQGITRKKVLELAAGMMAVEERDIPAEELAEAAEIFLTATTKRILPVVKLNDRIVGTGTPGVFTTRLYRQFLQLEKGLS